MSIMLTLQRPSFAIQCSQAGYIWLHKGWQRARPQVLGSLGSSAGMSGPFHTGMPHRPFSSSGFSRARWTPLRAGSAENEPDKTYTLGDFRNYQSAKDFVWRLGMKEKEEWWEWERSGERPADIPSHPDRAYRGEGWESWEEWLGVGRGGRHVEEFRPFEDARSFARSLGLKNIKEWRDFSESGQRPPDVPWAPDHAYKDEWESWEDFLLGNGGDSLAM